MISDEDDLLSYTPLKRLKTGCSQSVGSSQLSYSEVQARTRNRSRLSSQPSKQKKSSTPKINTPNSSVPKLSQNKKKQTPLKFKQPEGLKEAKNAVNCSISRSNCKSSLLESSVEPSLSKGRYNTNTRVEKNKEKNINNLYSKDTTNIFDDNTPDIDLTQVIQSVSSVGSDDDANSQSLLINNHENSHSNVELPTLNAIERDNNDKLKNGKNPSNGTTVIWNNSQISGVGNRDLNDDSEDDFLHIEDHVQTGIKRVNSWLEDSIEQGVITPKKVEYVRSDSSESSCKPHETDGIQEDNDDRKTCVHLHFHVNTPGKFIQPTLEHFFKKSVNDNPPNGSVSHENLYHSRNGENVLKAWSKIMKKNDEALPGSSKSKQFNVYKPYMDQPKTAAVPNRTCPFYKRVEDTNFVVDGFSYGHINGVTAYFLSHFHCDHYIGLSKKFQKPIYCSQITANLIRLKLYVGAQYIRPLPLEESRVIDGVEVTLYESNHCPGAVMFLFKLCTGKTVLHVGDFRAHPDMETISELWNGISVLYLDTTYLDKNYDFYSQDEVLEKCRSIARDHIQRNRQTLFVVGSYTIGKEKVFKAIASELDCKIYAPPFKEKILNCLEDQEIKCRLTNDKEAARVHVVSMQEITPPKLKKYMDSLRTFKILVAIRPTGWEYNSSIDEALNSLTPKQIGNIYIYGLPYSEHSSFLELQRFVKFVQAEKIIPTVNVGSARQREKMKKYLDEWQREGKKKLRI